MTYNNGPAFLYWCARAILRWKGDPAPRPDILHLHGTKDKMFPVKLLKNIIPVAGGTHLMLLSRAEEITNILMAQLFPGGIPETGSISI